MEINLSDATYAEMAAVVRGIAFEVKRRNPLFCNYTVGIANGLADDLSGIGEFEDEIQEEIK